VRAHGNSSLIFVSDWRLGHASGVRNAAQSTNLGAPTIRWASSIKLSHIPALFAQSESRTKS